MRLTLALVVVTLLAPTLASATAAEEPRDGITVTVIRITGLGAHLVWTPAPGAITYEIYRGATLETLERIAETASLEFTDLSTPPGDVWYEVVTRRSQIDDGDDGEHGPGPMRGRCLATRGTGIALTIANCMPAQGPVSPLLPAEGA